MADFAQAVEKVLRHEGLVRNEAGEVIADGYCNHPDDPGGETIWGITRDEATINGWEGTMTEMPLAFAVDIYRRKYWLPLWGEEIKDQGIANELLDTAVNCGLKTSVMFLQRALNVLNIKETLWQDVAIDGLMGGTTVITLNAACSARPYMGLCVLRALDCLQGARYITLAENNKKFESFLPGWLFNRCGTNREA